jgi:hypothetical protein
MPLRALSSLFKSGKTLPSAGVFIHGDYATSVLRTLKGLIPIIRQHDQIGFNVGSLAVQSGRRLDNPQLEWYI